MEVRRRCAVDVSQVVVQLDERGYDSPLMENTKNNSKDRVGGDPGDLGEGLVQTPRKEMRDSPRKLVPCAGSAKSPRR